MNKRPNVILISIDTLRADHLSCYGYGKNTTPHLDSLAREGTICRNNFSTGVWTPPGHASMLTGLHVYEHGVYDTRALPPEVPTLAELLQKAGYRTAGFVNNSQVGELVGLDRGHEYFEEVWKGENYKTVIDRGIKGLARMMRRRLGRGDSGAARTNELVMEWLGKAQPGVPFYAFIHYIDAHNPLDPPAPYRERFLGQRRLGPAVRKAAQNPLICYVEDLDLSEGDIAALKALYDGEIAYLDQRVGEITAFLRARGLYDDTMIIITSDHGEHFGEYGNWSHVASLYKEVLHVPLIIKYPRGVAPAGEIRGYTQSVDILPTVLETAGLSGKAAVKTSGLSLLKREGADKVHECVFAEWEGRIPFFIQKKIKDAAGAEKLLEDLSVKMSMVMKAGLKLVVSEKGEERLFDVSSGSEAPIDVSENSAAVRELRAHLESARDEDAAAGKKYEIDSEIMKNLESLGYM